MTEQISSAEAVQTVVDAFYSQTCVNCPLDEACQGSNSIFCEKAIGMLRALNVQGLERAEQAYKEAKT